MSTKFGLLIDFDILKTVTSTKTKPELLFSGRGSHLENGNDVIFLHISELNTIRTASQTNLVHSLAVEVADSI